MPFTGSHPALILPLLNRRLFSVSGLIMGSMVPDFEFFIRLEAEVVHGHSFWAIFWLNLPLAICCISLYHLVVRNQLILNLPVYFRKRFRSFLTFDWFLYLKADYVKVIYSILIGNLSHLFSDAFTHYDGFIVQIIPILNLEYWNVPIYDMLQYGLSFLGAICIIGFIDKLPSNTLRGRSLKNNMLTYWLLVSLTTLVVYLLRYNAEDYENFGARIVFLCAGFMVGLIVASSAFNLGVLNNRAVFLRGYQTKKP